MTMGGLSFSSDNLATNLYKFTGKENQDEHGLAMIDFGWRQYDNRLGRWFVVDKLAELETNTSPYAYVTNNPVKYIDPNGMFKYLNKHLSIYYGDGGGSPYGGGGGGSYGSAYDNFVSQIGGPTFYESNTEFDGLWTRNSDITTIYDASWGYDLLGIDPNGNIKIYDETLEAIVDLDNELNIFKIFGDITINGQGTGGDQAQSTGGDQVIWSILAAFSAEDIYNNFGHKHSPRAAKFAWASTTVNVLGTIGAFLATANASYNIANGSNNVLDYTDATVGAAGLINAGAMQWTSFGIPVVGQAVSIYFGARVFYDLTLDMTNYYMENNINPGNQFIIFKE